MTLHCTESIEHGFVQIYRIAQPCSRVTSHSGLETVPCPNFPAKPPIFHYRRVSGMPTNHIPASAVPGHCLCYMQAHPGCHFLNGMPSPGQTLPFTLNRVKAEAAEVVSSVTQLGLRMRYHRFKQQDVSRCGGDGRKGQRDDDEGSEVGRGGELTYGDVNPEQRYINMGLGAFEREKEKEKEKEQ